MSAVIDDLSGVQGCHPVFSPAKDGTFSTTFYSTTLSSSFQPVFSLSHRRPIGYEGLLRIREDDGTLISPSDAFNTVQSEPHIVELDKRSRLLHLKNYSEQADEQSWLFLNVHPATLANSDKYQCPIEEVLRAFDIDPTRLVIEIIEDAIKDTGLLNETIQHFRSLGCMIAIDDFGSGRSNFDRIWRIQPDIVKLDKTIIGELNTNKMIQRILPNLVSLIHESGSLVLVEGVENEEQALVTIESEADFVQGFYFAKPEKLLHRDVTSSSVGEGGLELSGLCSAYQSRINQTERNRSQIMTTYIRAFELVARAIDHTDDFENVMQDFLSFSGVERCYMLDRNGSQIGHNLFPDDHAELFPARFPVLESQPEASWFRRSYFRKAIRNPGEVNVSRPYLSMTAGIVCITLSILIKSVSGRDIVLCCDIDWTDR